MKKTFLLAIFLSAGLNHHAAAQDRGFGLGIVIGEPTGISLKNWQGRTTALDGALAWSFAGNDFIQLHGDYLSHNFSLLKVEEGQLPFYYGIGGRIKFTSGDKNKNNEDKTRLGVRIPLGLAYLFEKVTLDIFVEVVPVLDLVPETQFDLNAAIGIRYFFSK
ncbi:MAG: hypothetical protein ALAOOOJD_02811 [bacterium]|nr:hypothetical protein [bacterium]